MGFRNDVRLGIAALLLFTAQPAVALATAPLQASKPIPKRYEDSLQKQLPRGQRLVQTLTADLDGDGSEEWIVVGEPTGGAAEGPSLSIFAAPKGKKAPELRWAQHLRDPKLRTSGAAIARMEPVGPVVLWVGAEPFHNGDSRFVVQAVGWVGEDFKPLVPETAEFRSQGGFAIVPAQAPQTGDSLVVWTYVRGENEQLYDLHRYQYRRWHWDGSRFAVENETHLTRAKLPTPDAAGKEAGANGPDLRRQIDRVAEVP